MMSSGTNKFRNTPCSFNDQVKEALSEWVKSLTPHEAHKAVIFVSGVRYTPSQILEEVENESDFGMKFLAGLYALNHQMMKNGSRISMVDLIRQSVKHGRS
jgi:hypothetical protein